MTAARISAVRSGAPDWKRTLILLGGMVVVALIALQFAPQPASPKVSVVARAGRPAAATRRSTDGSRSRTRDTKPDGSALMAAASEGTSGPEKPAGRDAAPATRLATQSAAAGDGVAGDPAPPAAEAGSGDEAETGIRAVGSAPDERGMAAEESDVSTGAQASLAGTGRRTRSLFQPLVATRSQVEAPAPAAQPPAPPKPAAVAPAPRLTPLPPPSVPTVAAPPSTEISASSLQMLGVVEFDGQAQVLIKNSQSGQRRYLAQGQEAFGFTVKTIKDSEVELERGGRVERVAMAKDVSIEGPGVAAVGRSSFGGFGGFGGGGRGFSGGGRGFGGRQGGDTGGGGNTTGSTGSVTTAMIMAPALWSDRLKKLEELKAQMEPARYETLKKFVEARAKEEAAAKK